MTVRDPVALGDPLAADLGGDPLRVARARLAEGQLAQAERLCRDALARDGGSAVALHLLGSVARQRGKIELAAKLVGQAVAADGGVAQYRIDLAELLARSGKAVQGIAHLEAALALEPDNGMIYVALGHARLGLGDAQAAIECFRRAAAANARDTAALQGLAKAFFACGQLDAAADTLRRAIDADLADADLHCNLALVLHARGAYADAVRHCEAALAIAPDSVAALNNLGLALHALGELERASGCLQRALQIDPRHAEACLNLGNVLHDQGQLGEACAILERAIALRPEFVAAHNNLANCLVAAGRAGDAVARLTKAAALAPGDAAVQVGLGNAYRVLGRLAQARASYERALRIRPDYALAHNNLGLAWVQSGEAERALECYRSALRVSADYAAAHSNLLLAMNYVPGIPLRDALGEHVRFAQNFEAPLKPSWAAHANPPDPQRRLRIGYVSGDFRQHAVMHLVEPVLARHDKGAYEIFCYSTALEQDAVTARLRRHADHWRSLVGRGDEAAARCIRDDAIDILVDLSGHTANNRLLVFARKPAPVQVAWAGYLGSSGLTAIDYRITDAHADPHGAGEAGSVEALWRLPSMMVYHPAPGSPPVNALPLGSGRPVTFASLNNLAKVTPDVVALWGRLLAARPEARLILGNCDDADTRDRLARRFAQAGVAAARLVFAPRLPLIEFLGLHHQIDFALDPFPYNGGATSCHSLWMGVPFVTLASDRTAGRMGVSLLRSVGLDELVARSPEEYVAIACAVTAGANPLADIRAGLRDRMSRSLADAQRFTRDLEAGYREMWRVWCAGTPARCGPPERSGGGG